MNKVLGGGMPSPSVVTFTSPSGAGKTTVLMFMSKAYAVQGHKVLILDFENAVSESLINGTGCGDYMYDAENPNGQIMVFKVSTFTDADESLDAFIDEVDLIIIDSATSILPEKMEDTSVEKVLAGLQARLMSNLLLKYRARLMKSKTTLILTVQKRVNINFMGSTTEKQAGGTELKYYTDVRLMMEKNTSKKNKDLETSQGVLNDIWCEKNRFTAPYQKYELKVTFGKGVDNDDYYMKRLIELKVFVKDGSWYKASISGEDVKLQGEKAFSEWISENRDWVRNFIRSKEEPIHEEDYSQYYCTDNDENTNT